MEPCPKGCSWEIGGTIDWTFDPDVYPSGEEMFATGSEANDALYTTAHNNALIKATDVSKAGLTTYENYLEHTLPVIWEPEPVTLFEVHKGPHGVIPLGPLTSFTPATDYWS